MTPTWTHVVHSNFQGWTLPPKVVTKIAESFAILTFGSSFMHGRFSIVHKNSTNIILILLFLGLSQRWVVLSYVISQQHETWSRARCTKQRPLPLCHSPGASSYSLPPGYINWSDSITTRIHKLTSQYHLLHIQCILYIYSPDSSIHHHHVYQHHHLDT